MGFINTEFVSTVNDQLEGKSAAWTDVFAQELNYYSAHINNERIHVNYMVDRGISIRRMTHNDIVFHVMPNPSKSEIMKTAHAIGKGQATKASSSDDEIGKWHTLEGQDYNGTIPADISWLFGYILQSLKKYSLKYRNKIMEINIYVQDEHKAFANSNLYCGYEHVFRYLIEIKVDEFHTKHDLPIHREVIGGSDRPIDYIADSFNRTFHNAINQNVWKESPVQLSSGQMPIIFPAGIGAIFMHEMMGHILELRPNIKPIPLNSQITSPLVDIVDDPLRANAFGSQTWDDEGNPMNTVKLVEAGHVKNRLGDEVSKFILQEPCAANARRESYRQLPWARMSNTYMTPGSNDPAEIIADTDFGVIADDLQVGLMQRGTGNFNIHILRGRLIRSGELSGIVSPFSVRGDWRNAIMSVDRVGTDLRFFPSYCAAKSGQIEVTAGQPTIRVDNLFVLPE